MFMTMEDFTPIDTKPTQPGFTDPEAELEAVLATLNPTEHQDLVDRIIQLQFGSTGADRATAIDMALKKFKKPINANPDIIKEMGDYGAARSGDADALSAASSLARVAHLRGMKTSLESYGIESQAITSQLDEVASPDAPLSVE
jgi:hypothetical protein